MRSTLAILLSALISFGHAQPNPDTEWISLFDGKSLNGWKASENPSTFSVENGMIKVFGDRAHLFYEGPVGDHDFKNFEFKAKVRTTPGSNSGIFFHTRFQETGWPSQGYEIQVNNTHTDWRKTGSIYAVQDVRVAPARDNEWFTEHIIVNGNKIMVKINDQVINEYEVKENSKLSRGTFALQGHDPKSEVYYQDIMVKILPD